jgi:hypothetical protein
MDSWPTTVDKPKPEPENWYTEPFTKRTGCKTPGQCDDNCDCGCPYTVTDAEQLPLIETIAQIFPNEWLAFITTPEEDEDYEPTHGKLIAHSVHPDDVYDAVDAVLWNQHVYVFFNGGFTAMQASYGDSWEQIQHKPVTTTQAPPPADIAPPLPSDLMALVYSVLDQLYNSPNINEAVRRLRLARVQATATGNAPLTSMLDHTLNQMETPTPPLNEIIWYLEDKLAELEASTEGVNRRRQPKAA